MAKIFAPVRQNQPKLFAQFAARAIYTPNDWYEQAQPKTQTSRIRWATRRLMLRIPNLTPCRLAMQKVFVSLMSDCKC